jgi:hypothetical protein
MHAYLSPASVAEAIQDTIDYIEGRSPGSYWDTRPGEETPRLPRWTRTSARPWTTPAGPSGPAAACPLPRRSWPQRGTSCGRRPPRGGPSSPPGRPMNLRGWRNRPPAATRSPPWLSSTPRSTEPVGLRG